MTGCARRTGALLLGLLLAAGCRFISRPGRVIVIGFDGLDPRAVELLSKEGQLPNFAKLRQDGIYSVLASREPLLSPVVWTTIATGKTEHGIQGFLAGSGAGSAPALVNSRMRKAKAVWNIASDGGRKVGVVGWWATWPAENVNGAVVSDRISSHFTNKDAFNSPGDPTGLTHPPELLTTLAPLVRQPSDVTLDELSAFATVEAADMARPFDFRDPLEHLKWMLASAETNRRIGLELWKRERPDLLLVYVEGTDSASHLFGRLFRAPPLGGGLALQQRRYAHTVEGMYRYADRILGDFVRSMDERTTLVVLSDHGFRLGDRPNDPERGTRLMGHAYHTLDGVCYVYGRGVRRGASLRGPGVLDVAPTVLALLGLGAGADMPGRVWDEALEIDVPPRIPSHENGAPHVDEAMPVSADDSETLERLRALGYISGGSETNARAGATDAAGDAAESARAYEMELSKRPDDLGLRVRLAGAYRALGRNREALAQLDAAVRLDPLNAAVYHDRGVIQEAEGQRDRAVRSYRSALQCDPSFKAAAAALARLTGSDRLVEPRNEAERRALALASEAASLADRRRYGEALTRLDEAQKLAPDLALVHHYRANVAFLMGNRDAAISSLRTALRLEPDNTVLRENLRRMEVSPPNRSR